MTDGGANPFTMQLVLETPTGPVPCPVPFSLWRQLWCSCQQYNGATIPDLAARIEALLVLWQTPIAGMWRGVDSQLLGRRYRRSGYDHASKEYLIEKELLADPLRELKFFAGAVIDGVNAVPLVQHRSGIEADLFLLVEEVDARPAVYVIEVKDDANNPWYALLENLLQLRCTLESVEARRLFHHRRTLAFLPPLDLPHRGMVLAPQAFYSADGQKGAAVTAAKQLIEKLSKVCGVHVTLAVWDAAHRTVELLP
jgi:hypothetical protein